MRKAKYRSCGYPYPFRVMSLHRIWIKRKILIIRAPQPCHRLRVDRFAIIDAELLLLSQLDEMCTVRQSVLCLCGNDGVFYQSPVSPLLTHTSHYWFPIYHITNK